MVYGVIPAVNGVTPVRKVRILALVTYTLVRNTYLSIDISRIPAEVPTISTGIRGIPVEITNIPVRKVETLTGITLMPAVNTQLPVESCGLLALIQ